MFRILEHCFQLFHLATHFGVLFSKKRKKGRKEKTINSLYCRYEVSFKKFFASLSNKLSTSLISKADSLFISFITNDAFELEPLLLSKQTCDCEALGSRMQLQIWLNLMQRGFAISLGQEHSLNLPHDQNLGALFPVVPSCYTFRSSFFKKKKGRKDHQLPVLQV